MHVDKWTGGALSVTHPFICPNYKGGTVAQSGKAASSNITPRGSEINVAARPFSGRLF